MSASTMLLLIAFLRKFAKKIILPLKERSLKSQEHKPEFFKSWKTWKNTQCTYWCTLISIYLSETESTVKVQENHRIIECLVLEGTSLWVI